MSGAIGFFKGLQKVFLNDDIISIRSAPASPILPYFDNICPPMSPRFDLRGAEKYTWGLGGWGDAPEEWSEKGYVFCNMIIYVLYAIKLIFFVDKYLASSISKYNFVE